MSKFRRILSVGLIAITLATSIPIESLAVQQELTTDNEKSKVQDNPESIENINTDDALECIENIEEIENSNSEEAVTIEKKVEAIEQEAENIETEKVVEENTEETIETVEVFEEKTEETIETEEIFKTEATLAVVEQEATESCAIEYLLINQSNVCLGEKQQIVLGIACDKKIESATLSYSNQASGETFQQSFNEAIDGALLFELSFEDISQSGSYQLDSVIFVADGNTYIEKFSEAGIEAVFGMNQEIEIESDAVIVDGTVDEVDTELNIVRIDEDGNAVSEQSFLEAIETVNEGQIDLFERQRASGIVVVLDPGHDNTHAGAQANGLGEEDLNLKIAKYCKTELETYLGVTVYLTRELDGECPYPGTSSGQCNKKRVEFAQSVGANIYVSLHNNSAENTSANGAMVFYPNSNYNSTVSEQGEALAEKIQEQLVALGLYDRGITVKDSADFKYSDGSAADYYAVIRDSKEIGVPAIIVEHAFVSNTDDANNFLTSEEKLKTLGVSDAAGIVAYYGLVKEVNATAASVQVSISNNDKGLAAIKAINVAPLDKIEKVSFAVWSEANQSNMYRYNVLNDGTGNYAATLDISKHGYKYGEYFVHAYAHDIYGKSHFIGGKTCSFVKPPTKISAVGNSKQTSYKLSITNLVVDKNIKSVDIAVWSGEDGQNDLVWYNATMDTVGEYVANVLITNHKTAGIYYAHAYTTETNGVRTFVAGTVFRITEPSVDKMEIANMSDMQDSFDIVLTGVQSVSGVSNIKIPVWSKSNQSDIYWYTASKQSDGSYIAKVNLSNHKYNYGKYNAHVYITTVNGIYKYVAGTTITVEMPKTQVAATANALQTSYTLNATNVWAQGSVKELQFAVWSQKNGQDDIVWYKGVKNSTGAYRVNVPITNHKENGLYYVNVYMTGINGVKTYVGGTTFNVTALTVEKIEIANKNDDTGTFDVVLKGIQSISGVNKVQVPVWSKSDQSDIYWYTASRQSDGSYIAKVNLTNHKYNYGEFQAHVYVTAVNGIYQFMGSTSVTMGVPKAKTVATVNALQTSCVLTSTGVGLQGGIKSLKFAVWSFKDGQDDLVWYTAKNIGFGQWTANVVVSNHKTAGNYYVNTYAVNAIGKDVYLGGTTFNVKELSASSVTLVDYNEENGTFGVKIVGVESASGISNVKVAVWSQKNGQDDLIWYNAAITSKNTYQISADVRKHNKSTGVYNAHVYITANNGIETYAGGVSANFTKFVDPITIYNGVDYALVYDFNYYREKYVDIKDAFEDDDVAALGHFVNQGMSEGRQGNDSFNVYTYRNRYPDLRNAYGDDLKAYYMHYINAGKDEGREAESIGSIVSCKIVAGSKDEMSINVSIKLEDAVQKYNEYYVVETDLYDASIEKVLETKEGTPGSVSFNIVISGEEQVKVALMDEFALAVKDENGNLILSSKSIVISNPEAIAANTVAIFKGTSKKGLQGIYYAAYEGGNDIVDARNANTKQTLLNLDLASVVSTTPKAGYEAYTYKGNTYYFSKLTDLKANIQSLNYGYKQYLYGNSGTTPVAVTLCLLLSYNSENSFLIDPAGRTPGHSYYMLNVREEKARETLEALFLYLGETFGQSNCYVSNWVLGNEINSSRAWNYSGGLDFNTYMECYATAFRLLYNGVKSEKTGNNVCISLDNGWTAAPDTYEGKTTLDTFAQKIHAQNPKIDWSIAYHAYSYPLTRADFWNDYTYTTDSLSTPYISMRNISVLTNYAGTLESTYGKASGSIRVLLTEQGYSYHAGAEAQAIAIARGFYIAQFNNRIDAFIIRAVVDDSDEATGGLYFGLMNIRHDKRIAFYVYEHMDSDLSKFGGISADGYVSFENYAKFNKAKEILCNTNWKGIVPGFDAAKLASIK